MRNTACECSQRQRRTPTLAQGNALGFMAKRIQALKGRNNESQNCDLELERPFRAWRNLDGVSFPFRAAKEPPGIGRLGVLSRVNTFAQIPLDQRDSHGEARSAETRSGSVHESPTPFRGDAQTLSILALRRLARAVAT